MVGMIGFGLGRLSAIWPKPFPVRIEEDATGEFNERNMASVGGAEETDSSNKDNRLPVLQGFVASKNGTSYHYPWCPGAKKIKEENKIVFATREEAEKRGYKPAGNCPGL
ncbi:MAG: hypothetical protein G01um101466_553 [Parcubacteria group bacterium Gr01-1014_66]|nr:MAG: hypothetical protein G01um101466_553 [Parcubacteria group bacterium Gr01-1014_66]